MLKKVNLHLPYFLPSCPGSELTAGWLGLWASVRGEVRPTQEELLTNCISHVKINHLNV